jgi:hypothetical protein
MNANYLCRRIFGTSLLTLFGVSLVLWRRERQITSIATPFYCPLSPNSQTSEFLIYSSCTFKIFLVEVVAIGRKNAGWESDRSAYTYSGPLNKAGIWTPLLGISSSNPILSQSRAEQSLFTPAPPPNPTILPEVTIYPGGQGEVASC